MLLCPIRLFVATNATDVVFDEVKARFLECEYFFSHPTVSTCAGRDTLYDIEATLKHPGATYFIILATAVGLLFAERLTSDIFQGFSLGG